MILRIYLSQVNLIQHHQTGTSIVVNQTPKVFDSVRQRMLGNDECSRLSVALQETKETKREKNQLSGLSCTQRCRPQTYSPKYLHPSFIYIVLSHTYTLTLKYKQQIRVGQQATRVMFGHMIMQWGLSNVRVRSMHYKYSVHTAHLCYIQKGQLTSCSVKVQIRIVFNGNFLYREN